MKYLFSLFVIILFYNYSYSQQTAVTDSGQIVLLYPNGTWKYKDDNKNAGWETSLDTLKYSKPNDANFLVKGNKVNYGIWINPKKWKFERTTNSESTPYEYKFKMNDEAFALIVPERIEISMSLLKEVVLKNIEKVASETKLIREDNRIVNGVLVTCMEYTATVDGTKFHYIGYFTSNENGCFQLTCGTVQNLFDNYKKEFINLLNGFVLQPKDAGILLTPPTRIGTLQIDKTDSSNQRIKDEEIKEPPPPIEKKP